MIQAIEAITTPRLSLREPRAADAAPLAELANDFDVARMTTSMPHPYTRADADEFLARMAARDRAREAIFAIEDARAGLVGVLGFHPKADAAAPELGYWIGRPHWGQGLATEAARAALRWADREWGKRWTIAGHFADNPASGRVLTKIGFLYTGVVSPLFSRARGAVAATRMMVRLA
ncbi:MAG TPA: GNAT family N-acetyltransferase [Caulobacteraceae bacterium]|nr:GNAT family N-acetyltransferase [Caulobacteraceae bacterium]